MLDEDFIQVGGGAAWNLTEKARLTAEARIYVARKNTLDRKTVSLGVAYDIN